MSRRQVCNISVRMYSFEPWGQTQSAYSVPNLAGNRRDNGRLCVEFHRLLNGILVADMEDG